MKKQLLISLLALLLFNHSSFACDGMVENESKAKQNIGSVYTDDGQIQSITSTNKQKNHIVQTGKTRKNTVSEGYAYSVKVKANNLVSVANGDNAKTVSNIGSIKSDDCKPHHIDIEVGNIIQENSGIDASSILELPTKNKNCL